MASKEKQKKGNKIMSFYKFYSNKPIKSEPTTKTLDKPISQSSPMSTVKEIRVQETDHGGDQRRRGAEEIVEARKSVSHVETNLSSVAAFLQVKVLVTDMPGFMQVHAFRSARRTFDSLEKFSSKHMAYNIKKEFDKVYGPAWHCIVGSSFGSFVTHSTGCFLYFSMEKLHILVFKTKVQKANPQ
ncbi:uncharacterized protein LOC119996748 [Tripterygium wilfordii]|uniref:uncharacterized protein LOC119996748 n=1 Tax=Tripterygium wilfordii TaxID=458696 RepID=UPI0018F847D3|nr:uncharacterized protein LOC119996748 [Tripterygium wilfordii]